MTTRRHSALHRNVQGQGTYDKLLALIREAQESTVIATCLSFEDVVTRHQEEKELKDLMR